jgi:CheY-like chemotaxis protein
VLLVNDEPFLLLGFSQQLANHFQVYTAENGFEAIKLVQSRPLDYFAAVILDISMPIIDGYEASINIYNYLNESQNILHTEKPVKRHWSLRRSRTLIFCLSADTSIETEKTVRAHPFDGTLTSLNQEEM